MTFETTAARWAGILLALSATATATVACSSDDSGTGDTRSTITVESGTGPAADQQAAAQVTRDYLTAWAGGDLDLLKQSVCARILADVDSLTDDDDFAHPDDDEVAAFVVEDAALDGDHGTVRFRAEIAPDPSSGQEWSEDDTKSTQTVSVVKENGDWKVCPTD